ncbi:MULTISPECIES: class II glutamine amidotransferase [unclassified Microbacterium]|uniref:class II glutamine amidotransferase n=1 Tax=unclassified Microbacterium TaxID=2609290 RepID=UPI00214C87C8|nr:MULTISPECIES: class II glutamine amidotransferase [unclassified Microbacterium]MCR2783386.1 class II glutamine amidotransferase [Microbacterium sp. zg.B96]WIM15744.1 class II glutamine amidotransferase [Microbacterium sp. zg-B96]
MCRWIAYLGSALPLEDILVRPDHSLIDQSLLARELYLPGTAMASQFREHAFPTNGDGFGVAWAGRRDTPGQYRQTTPAWDSDNLRHLAAEIESGCFLAHVRAAPGGTIAEQNSHPFVHGRWMFQHNGEISGFADLKRELTMAVAPELYPFIRGTTDSEVCFFLALTYGLATDPVAALRRMVERVETARRDHGTSGAFRGAMCVSDGDRLVVLRWSSPDATQLPPPSLFHSAGPETLHVGEGRTEQLPRDAQLVVSEPLELHWSRRRWQEIPASTIGVITRDAAPVFTALS